MNRYKSGLFVNITITATLIFLFFSTIIKNPNEYFYSKGGDGLKGIYGAYYHLKWDTAYLHTNSMNYPYGESVFYTGAQPLLINSLKVLSWIGVPIEDNFLGIFNLWLLSTILLATVFLFLLFIELGLPIFYSIIASNIIVFLSPLFIRMGGHFDLAYMFILPLFLYLIKHFYETPTYKISIIIGLVSFFALVTHAYFFSFYAYWIFFLLLYIFFFEKTKGKNLQTLLFHFIIQIIIPYIFLVFLTFSYPNDRTAFPWGFFATQSFPAAVFLPLDKPYSNYLHFSYIKWEGIAFIGMVASIVSIFLALKIFIPINFKQKFSLKKRLNLTGSPFLNAILLGSVVALLISFAYPFTWHLEKLLNYTGPFRQFRASGRFNILFFYCINIISFYLIWNFHKRRKNLISYTFIVFSLLWGTYDAYLNVKNVERGLCNKIPELTNSTKKHQYLQKINTDNYQAILSIPFFHVGSEIYWVINSNESVSNAFIASWETGLPLFNVLLSRTSISQSVNSLALFFEPLSDFQIINDLPSKKDILLLKSKIGDINKNEQRFLNQATLISDDKEFDVYKLSIDSIIKLNNNYKNNIIKNVSQLTDTILNQFVCNNYDAFLHESFGGYSAELPGTKPYLSFKAKEPTTIFNAKIKADSAELTISLWINHLNQDIIPRSTIKASTQTASGLWSPKYTGPIHRTTKYIAPNGWGLIEFKIKPNINDTHIRIEIWNDLATSEYIDVDEILIRQTDNNIYYKTNNFAYFNNRFIKLNN